MLILVNEFVRGDIAILDRHNKSIELLIDYKITYTPTIPDEGLFGALIIAEPPDACIPIKSAPNSSINWFVLAYRSSFKAPCSNREKIQHAAEAGFKAIILYSHFEHFQTAINYSPFENTNTSIPALLVSHDDGMELQHFLHSSGYRIFITSELPPNISYYLIPFAIVIGAGILIIISYLIFQLMMCIMERRKAQRYRLSKKYLKKLTLQKFEKGIFYETCAICLDDYLEGEKIRILPCNHAYHMKCIDPWLTKNRRVCPVCKAKVTFPGMEEFTDSDSDNDHRRLVSSEPASETTRLLSSNASRHTNRYTFNRLLRITNPRSSQYRSQHREPPSTSRYEILDNSLIQPGPSTSAPIISELISNRDESRRNRRKKRHSTRSNVQVVVADIVPILAPPQLSINCDLESESSTRVPGMINVANNVDEVTTDRAIDSHLSQPSASLSQPVQSSDQIV
ncbi:E3 ubiquitin-protein ligase RNF13-like protein [Sarcoptes scabiei]|uniref:E3 ubiquitin-protein ligase RNF13-like protein n=2 Tax=Sarcoptes scabiei TaxID=52283 RepID=A0A132A2R2_SARSC|nr:E3 ubiquitin-protein ligase RNF13-like protein [Sarcoptes scabiei]